MKYIYKRQIEDAKAMGHYEVLQFIFDEARESLKNGEHIALVITWEKPTYGSQIEKIISNKDQLEQLASAYEDA